MPSFHVLIASIGRESLHVMLNSLIPQLNSEDHITIVFDGVPAIPMYFRENKCKIHDSYFPNAFDNLRVLCANKRTLYVARMLTPAGVIPFLKQTKFQSIKNNYIGTPCGVIPFEFNGRAIWELRHGGDKEFYVALETFTTVKFLNIIIYHVPTWIKSS